MIDLVTTIYNRANYLEQTIESVLSSSHAEFKYLLWDDGSTDDSLDVALQFAGDERILIRSGPHEGAGAALAGAFAAGNGEYLGHIDSDDLLGVRAVELCAAILDSRPEIGCVYTWHNLIGPNGEDLGPGETCQYPYTRERLLGLFMTGHFRLMRRSVYEACGGIDPTLPAAIDYDLMLRMSEITEVVCLPEIHYSYRQHPDRISERDRDIQERAAVGAISRALLRRG